MVKMKSERPLYVNGMAATEFETTDQHAKELESAGLAKRVGGKPDETQAEQALAPEPLKSADVKAPAPENKMAAAPANKAAPATAAKKQESK